MMRFIDNDQRQRLPDAAERFRMGSLAGGITTKMSSNMSSGANVAREVRRM